MKTWVKRICIAFLVLIFGLGMGFKIYTSQYYHASKAAASVHETKGIKIKNKDHRIVFQPVHARTGIVFYPGAKVDVQAYQPLMNELAKQGLLCVLIQMPENLVILDGDAAEGIPESYPQIKHWYIGGIHWVVSWQLGIWAHTKQNMRD